MTGDTGDLKLFLAHVAQGRSLSESQAEAAFEIIMSGNATPSQIGAFLMALRVRGETVEEIAMMDPLASAAMRPSGPWTTALTSSV